MVYAMGFVVFFIGSCRMKKPYSGVFLSENRENHLQKTEVCVTFFMDLYSKENDDAVPYNRQRFG